MVIKRRAPLFVLLVALSLVTPIVCAAAGGAPPLSSSLAGPAGSGTAFSIGGSDFLLADTEGIADGDEPGGLEPSAPSGEWKNAATTEALSPDFPKMALADACHVFTGPARWDKKDWALFAGAALAVGSLGLFDRQVKEEMRRVEERNDNEWAQQIRRFGGAYSFAALGLFYAGGLAFDDSKARSVALDGAIASALASGLMVPALKFTVGRDRPNAHNGTYAFRPFSGDRASFPSGESCQAFAVASVVASHYDQLWIKGASYGLASMVALARLYLDGHFLSDVAAGALIGTVVGRAVVHYNEKNRNNKEQKRSISVVPFFNGTSGGLLLTVS